MCVLLYLVINVYSSIMTSIIIFFFLSRQSSVFSRQFEDRT